MGLSNFNKKLASGFAKTILNPVRLGENGVFFWFPGSGMTTIIKDIFSDKSVLESVLKGLSSRIEVLQFWGHLCMERTSEDYLKVCNFLDFESLSKHVQGVLEKGKEVVFVLGRIDNFPEKEKIKIFKTFVKLNSINKRRVHTIINLVDKPWFEKAIINFPEIAALSNTIEIVPLISDEILSDFIKIRSKDFGISLSKKDLSEIARNYGGILTLIKEYLRSGENRFTLELKLKVLWNDVPESYKRVFEEIILGIRNKKNSRVISDLKTFNLLGIEVFKSNWSVLSDDSEKILPKLLTEEETDLWKFINEKRGKVITKDDVISILRSKEKDDISLWAIDQAVSRFRRKLARAGIDPELLKTIKGRGYIWQ